MTIFVIGLINALYVRINANKVAENFFETSLDSFTTLTLSNSGDVYTVCSDDEGYSNLIVKIDNIFDNLKPDAPVREKGIRREVYKLSFGTDKGIDYVFSLSFMKDKNVLHTYISDEKFYYHEDYYMDITQILDLIESFIQVSNLHNHSIAF